MVSVQAAGSANSSSRAWHWAIPLDSPSQNEVMSRLWKFCLNYWICDFFPSLSHSSTYLHAIRILCTKCPRDGSVKDRKHFTPWNGLAQDFLHQPAHGVAYTAHEQKSRNTFGVSRKGLPAIEYSLLGSTESMNPDKRSACVSTSYSVFSSNRKQCLILQRRQRVQLAHLVALFGHVQEGRE